MAAMRVKLALAVTCVLAAALTACGGGGSKTPTTTSPPTKPAKTTFAPPISNAELLRRLPASCRRQLLDPRMPASIRDGMWRDYRRRLTLHPDAARHMTCVDIASN
jgi:hypothetical protein